MKQRPSNLAKWVMVVSVVTLFLCLSTSSALADPFIIDQRNDDFPPLGGFGFGASPLGQEFTPTFSGLDVVEILIGPRAPNAVTTINIRIGSITGTIIGMSLPSIIDDSFPGPPAIMRFDFLSTVPLVSGNLYVFEVLPGNFAGPIFSNSDTYPGGRSIVSGNPFPNSDMWFREGIRATQPIPEPITMLLLGTGLAGLGAAVRKRLKAQEREEV